MALEKKIAAVVKREVIQARQLAAITGTLILMTMATYALIERRASWCDTLNPDRQC